MNDKDIELGVRILPGVDLALWLRLIVFVLLVAVGIGFAAA
jgi:hypothetical protein